MDTSRRPTLKDVARAAGVSLASASYAINGSGSVGEATRAHILQVAAGLGYRPNTSAKAMKTGRTGALGLVLPDLTNPFFPSLAQAVLQTARRQGYNVLLADTGGALEEERTAIRFLIDQGVDGLLWFPIDDTNPKGRRPAPEMDRIPVVVLDRNLPDHDVVLADYALGGRLAAEHLIAAGHVEIGVISGPHAASSARDRTEGAVQIIQQNARLAWQVENAFSLDLDPTAQTALARREVTAVIAGSDMIAIGAIRHLQNLGLAVPDDVSVIGFDDIPWAALNNPPLTTIDMPIEAMVVSAIETLVQRIAEGPGARRRTVFDVSLVERASVRSIG
ncbi:LacI family DNA-binding transcriptional regulator [uncultured Brevundimonas sp.]|uniref:LacI family DNA-binding transcriptional regulator n=1 Tax=uncultured Brevundimonas sp. TaxID=213418 RepID=UPI00260F4901|nr:LacI family DNA-binding transcriptional regulator [uncultured Brevundimonas sp.]